MVRHVWSWDCDRCGSKMALRDSLGAAEFDRDEHIKRCHPHANRAPWERNIWTSTIPTFDA